MIPNQKNVSNDRPLMDQCCPSVHLSVSQPVGVFTGPPAVNHQSLSLSPSQNTHALWPGLLDQRLTPGLHTWTGASRPRWSWIQLVQLCLSDLFSVFRARAAQEKTPERARGGRLTWLYAEHANASWNRSRERRGLWICKQRHSSQCGTLDMRCNAGSSPTHACGGNIYILYFQDNQQKT